MLSENIKQARRNKGLSQEDLAIRLNVVRQTVSKWENNLSVPDSDMLVALSTVLEMPVSALLGETMPETDVETMKSISEKLETLNYQLAKKKEAKEKRVNILLIIVCISITFIFFA